jgi:hypothetical protein
MLRISAPSRQRRSLVPAEGEKAPVANETAAHQLKIRKAVLPMKLLLLAAFGSAALAVVGPAGAQYAAYPYPPPYPYYAAPVISPAQAYPPSWSYDPYTSGMTTCPQKRPGDTQPCSEIMPPTYGQPSYWPTR